MQISCCDWEFLVVISMFSSLIFDCNMHACSHIAISTKFSLSNIWFSTFLHTHTHSPGTPFASFLSLQKMQRENIENTTFFACTNCKIVSANIGVFYILDNPLPKQYFSQTHTHKHRQSLFSIFGFIFLH